jgi:hypothetical protein
MRLCSTLAVALLLRAWSRVQTAALFLTLTGVGLRLSGALLTRADAVLAVAMVSVGFCACDQFLCNFNARFDRMDNRFDRLDATLLEVKALVLALPPTRRSGQPADVGVMRWPHGVANRRKVTFRLAPPLRVVE